MRWSFRRSDKSPPEGLLRRLSMADGPALIEHFLRLDGRGRCERFGMSASDAFLRAYATRCLEFDEAVFGFQVDGQIRGAGELRSLGAQKEAEEGVLMEAAFSVEPEWRGKGIGGRLMASVVITARGCGATAIYLACLPQNATMQRLARKFDARIRFESAPLRLSQDEDAEQRYATAIVAL